MITKSLDDLAKEKEKYEKQLSECFNEEEKTAVKKAYINNLKLYLFETKQVIKEIYDIELTPFKTVNSSYDGLLRKTKTGGTTIYKKTKQEFFNDIDKLLESNIYLSLTDNQKSKINDAFYILKTYYEDELS